MKIIVASLIASLLITAVLLMVGGCAVAPTTAPTTGPTLTQAQQDAITALQVTQGSADTANAVFQGVAAADPSLAADAVIAAAADKELDVIAPQAISDIQAGTVPPAVLEAQITQDLLTILQTVAKHPAASAKYESVKAAKLAAK